MVGPAKARISEYTVAPGVTYHYEKPRPFQWLYYIPRDVGQVSSQLGEAILSTGLVVQTLKHLTGRQSPYLATRKRGDWELLPSYNDYQHFVPNHDAFPTGHLAMATPAARRCRGLAAAARNQ